MSFSSELHVRDGDLARELGSIATLARFDPLEEPNAFWDAVHTAAARLPTVVVAAARKGVALMRGLPSEQNVPATPSDSRRPVGRHVLLSEFWLSVIGVRLGTPFAYCDQQAGAI